MIPPRKLFLVALFSLLLMPFSRAFGAEAGVTNRVNELTFTSTKTYVDPFNEVELNMIVTAPDGTRQRVPAFWAGGNSWRCRYASPQVGAHQWITECSDAGNRDLNGVEGTLELKLYDGDNPLYKHGFLRVASDKQHFEHADGTPFFWLADTWWMSLTKRLPWPEGFKTLTADRVDKGFTVVQIVAGLYPDMPAFDERGANEAGFPWTKDYSHINPAYFDMADRRIAWLADHGIAPCIVGAWGYHLPWLGVDKMKQHWRYIVARYSAYPGFWCIAGEADMPYYLAKDKAHDAEFQKTGWTQICSYVHSIDPLHHPVSLHPVDLSRTQVTDPAVLDFEMLQTGHGDRASIPPTLALVHQSRTSLPTMPTINSEVCYEGILGTCHEDLERFMVWSCLLSGTAGHTYGANGIWQVNEPGRPYGKSPHGGTYGPTPWNEAMVLPGSRQTGLAKKLLERFDWWTFEPHTDWATYATADASLQPAWGKWIWFPEGDPSVAAPVAKRYFRKSFDLPADAKIESATLWLGVDDRFSAFVNGKPVGARTGWESPQPMNISALLVPGHNVLAVEAENLPASVAANPAGLIASVRIKTSDGKDISIPSDSSWLSTQDVKATDWTSPNFDDHAWSPAMEIGPYGRMPWGQFTSHPIYGPFAAGIAGKVRVIYVPDPAVLRVEHLENDVKYRAKFFDPSTGDTTDIGDVQADAQGNWTIALPVASSHASDSVVILEHADWNA